MVYAFAVDGLDADGRVELDTSLDVAGWPAAGQTPAQVERRRAQGPTAPAWWHGEEEASQSFLKGLGLSPAALDRLAAADASSP